MKEQDSKMIGRLKSRRNEVVLLEDGEGRRTVKKRYADAQGMRRERKNLEMLQGLRVPKICGDGADFLLLLCIAGKTLSEALEECECKGQENTAIFGALEDWLCAFDARCHGRILDANLRNFLYDGRVVYGVDFEEEIPVEPYALEKNLGTILAYYLLDDPKLTAYKRDAVSRVLQRTVGRMNFEQVQRCLQEELERIEARRKGNERRKIRVLPEALSIIQIEDLEQIGRPEGFFVLARTGEETSAVIQTEQVPHGCAVQEDGFRAFYFEEVLEFSLIGILAKISGVLAQERIGIFVVSTYNTDYILVRDTQLEKALAALKRAGYEVAGEQRTERG